MNVTTQLLDTIHHKKGWKDAEIARILGVCRSSLSDMRHRRRHVPGALAIDLAKLAGLDPCLTLVRAMEEAAGPETRDTWTEIHRQLCPSHTPEEP